MKEKKLMVVLSMAFTLVCAATLAGCGGNNNSRINGAWVGSGGELKGYILIFQDGRAFLSNPSGSLVTEEVYNFSGKAGTFYIFQDENINCPFTLDNGTLILTRDDSLSTFTRGRERGAKSVLNGIWSNKEEGQTAVFADAFFMVVGGDLQKASTFNPNGRLGDQTYDNDFVILTDDDGDGRYESVSINGNIITIATIGGKTLTLTKGFAVDKENTKVTPVK